jgi:hypothetical protein
MVNKVLFITSDKIKDSYGITSGLFNSASFVVSFLNKNGVNAKLASIPDSNSIDKVVTEFNPDIVIIEALWVPPYKFVELFNIERHKGRRWIVRIHSKAPFLSMEGMATKWIRDYTAIKNGNIEIAPNTKELTKQLDICFPMGRFIYLPNIYTPKEILKPLKHVDEDIIDIGCFGAIRPMKNIYQQAIAAIEFAEILDKRLRFHVNSSRTEQNGNNVLKNLKALFEFSPHELVEHGWYTHKEFLAVASKMDVCMQVSLSESFNIVTADVVSVDVPIVVSTDIEWMPWILKTTPTSHDGIVKKLMLANSYPNLISKIQKFYLKRYNNKAEKIWLKKLHQGCQDF